MSEFVVRRSRQMERLLRDALGTEIMDSMGVNSEDQHAQALLHDPELGSILGRDTVRVAIVGTANVGKSSLVNGLFGEGVMVEGARSDVTNRVTRVDMESGLVLYDTPGLAGLDDQNEEITRAYLGMTPYENPVNTIPLCFLDKGTPCPNQRSVEQDGGREITLPEPEECTDKYRCANARNLDPEDEELLDESPDVVLHVFNLRAGLKRDDKQAFKALQAECNALVIPVGNFVDHFMSETDLRQAIQGAQKLAPDIVCVDSKTGTGLKALVQRILDSLDTAKVDLFNQELSKRYQVSRDEVFCRYVAQVAAKAVFADTKNKIERLSPDPDDPEKQKKMKLTEVDLLSEVLALRVMIDYMFDEKTWREGRVGQRMGEMLANSRAQVTSLLGGGATAGSIMVALFVASGMAGNLGFYAVAAVILGWFGLGGAAWMALIAAVGGPFVVIPALGILIGSLAYGAVRLLRPGSKYGGYSAAYQIYFQAFFLRRYLLLRDAGKFDKLHDDKKAVDALKKKTQKAVKKRVHSKLYSHKEFINKKVKQYSKDPADSKLSQALEQAIAERLITITPESPDSVVAD